MVDQGVNPYEFSDGREHVEGVVVSGRPGGITAVCVIAIILGSLGALAGLGGIVGPAMGKAIQQGVITAAEQNPENEELQMQADLQRQSMALADKYSVMNMVLGCLMLLLCGSLVVAAIMTLNGSETGRKLLAALCLLIVLVDLGKVIIQSIQQKEMMAGMSGAMTGAFENDPNLQGEESEKAKEVMGSVMKIGAIVAIAFGALWFLVKAIFYIFSWRYLNRPEVKAFFQTKAEGT